MKKTKNSLMKDLDLASENGASLMMVIMATVALGLITAGLNQYVASRSHERTVEDLRRSRDYVYKTLLRSSSDPAAIFLSSREAGNEALKTCITASKIDGCPFQNPENARAFKLVVPMSAVPGMHKITMTTADESGPEGTFDRFGNDNCSDNAKCLFRGTTQFWLDCPAGVNCQTSGRIMVRTQVKKNSAWNSNADPLHLGNLNIGVKDSRKEGEDMAIPVAAIQQLGLQRCPSGAHAVGLDAQGKVDCRCWLYRDPRLSGSDPLLACPPVACPPDQEILGLELNPDAVKNSTLPQYKLKCSTKQIEDCKSLPIDTTGSTVGCEEGWKLKGFAPPQCTVPLPNTVKELDALINANKGNVNVCTKYGTKSVFIGSKKNGEPIYKTEKDYNNCQKWVTKKKCPRTEANCWLPYVQINCEGSKGWCCKIPR